MGYDCLPAHRISMPSLIFKICTIEEWAIADMGGMFEGSEVDLADGFIHFSTEDQIEGTAAKYFAGQEDLLLIAVNPAEFGASLKWEKARDGDLFPHLYGHLDTSVVTWVIPMPIAETGQHILPALDAETF